MHRSAFESIVVVFAMGRSAVDERGAERIDATDLTKRRRRTRLNGRKRCCHIIFRSCRHREPGDVEKKLSGRFDHACLEGWPAKARQPRRQQLGDGGHRVLCHLNSRFFSDLRLRFDLPFPGLTDMPENRPGDEQEGDAEQPS